MLPGVRGGFSTARGQELLKPAHDVIPHPLPCPQSPMDHFALSLSLKVERSTTFDRVISRLPVGKSRSVLPMSSTGTSKPYGTKTRLPAIAQALVFDHEPSMVLL